MKHANLEKLFGQIMNTKVLAVIFIVGIGLVALPMGSSSKDKEVIGEERFFDTYREDTEEALENMLSKVKGVGNAEVMITFASGGQTFFAADEQSDNQSEKDEEQKTATQTTYVLKNDAGGGESPLVMKQNTPEVAGVLVVATGAKDPAVKSEIVNAVRAVLGVKAHRVEVLEKK